MVCRRGWGFGGTGRGIASPSLLVLSVWCSPPKQYEIRYVLGSLLWWFESG